jgi:hypothetical protein
LARIVKVPPGFAEAVLMQRQTRDVGDHAEELEAEPHAETARSATPMASHLIIIAEFASHF